MAGRKEKGHSQSTVIGINQTAAMLRPIDP
jgi:hypothetical protein